VNENRNKQKGEKLKCQLNLEGHEKKYFLMHSASATTQRNFWFHRSGQLKGHLILKLSIAKNVTLF
jgi:hypothetical protein